MYDVRPKINAFGNKISGKGYESNSNYRNIEIDFLPLENIHYVRSSYEKIISAFYK